MHKKLLAAGALAQTSMGELMTFPQTPQLATDGIPLPRAILSAPPLLCLQPQSLVLRYQVYKRDAAAAKM